MVVQLCSWASVRSGAALANAQHHMVHFQELASSPEVEQVAEILDLLDQSDLHQAEHEIQELLGEEGHHN